MFNLATKDINDIPDGMLVGKSRLSESTGIKLLWDKLNTKVGDPLRSASRVLYLG